MSVLSHLAPALAEVECPASGLKVQIKRVNAVDVLKQGRLLGRMLEAMVASESARQQPLEDILRPLTGPEGQRHAEDVEAVVMAAVVAAWDPDAECWQPFQAAPHGTEPCEAESGAPGVLPLDLIATSDQARIAWAVLEHSVGKEVVQKWTGPFRLLAQAVASLGLAGPSVLGATLKPAPAAVEPVDGGSESPSAVDRHSGGDDSSEASGPGSDSAEQGQEGDQAPASELAG